MTSHVMYSQIFCTQQDQSRHSSEEKTFPLAPSNDMTPTKYEIDHVTTKYDLDANHGKIIIYLTM